MRARYLSLIFWRTVQTTSILSCSCSRGVPLSRYFPSIFHSVAATPKTLQNAFLIDSTFIFEALFILKMTPISIC